MKMVQHIYYFILVATTTGHLLEMPWAFLDPRRPLGEPKEEGAIPYIPELPMLSESMINYNKSLMRVDGIYTTPSSLESTCLVFVYGLGNFIVVTIYFRYNYIFMCFRSLLYESCTFENV